MLLRPDVEHHAGVFELDVTTGRIDWSEHALELLGLQGAEADLEALLRCIDPREREAVRHGFLQAVFEARALEAACHVVQPDGRRRQIALRVQPVVDAAGRSRRMLGVCQHLKQQKAA